ncbi:MAG: type transport system permease protein [Verrucomicrobiota bacterium]
MFLIQLCNELRKLFGKRRTYIGFGAFFVAQNLICILFRFTKVQQDIATVLQGNGYLAANYTSALTIAVYMLIPQVLLLMPLYATLVGGDMVAKEAEDGTLRMILSRPITRVRLLFLKWLAGVVFSFVLVIVLGLVAIGIARCWFPWKGMFVFIPQMIFSVLEPGEGLKLYACSQIFLAINAVVAFSVAFMFSCFDMKPAAATILALSLLFLNLVLDNIQFFERYKEYFLPYHFRSWLYVFAHPTPWSRLGESQFILAGVALSMFIIGAAAFQIRDFKS